MFEFSVDFEEFLKLTRTQFGEYSLYLIESTGVRARDSEDDLNYQSRLKNINLHPDVVHFVRGARLDFPTTAPKLVEWQRKNNDFQLPEWFVGAARASTEQEAAAFLDRADKELRPFAEAWKAQLRITPPKMGKKESGRKGGQTANKLNREQKDEMLDYYKKNLVSLNNKDKAAHILKQEFPRSNAKESTIRNWLKRLP
jgi:hypothetical protein